MTKSEFLQSYWIGLFRWPLSDEVQKPEKKFVVGSASSDRPDVKAGARLRRGSRLFAILSVHDPDESGRYLVCLTREEQL